MADTPDRYQPVLYFTALNVPKCCTLSNVAHCGFCGTSMCIPPAFVYLNVGDFGMDRDGQLMVAAVQDRVQMPDPIEVDELVRRLTGGPTMLVLSIAESQGSDAATAMCAWLHDRRIVSTAIPVDQLASVPTEDAFRIGSPGAT